MPRKTPSGGIDIPANGFIPVLPSYLGGIGIPITIKNPLQILGLTPLFPCTSDECRELDPNLPPNIVFGNIIGGTPESMPSYKNDFTPLLIDLSLYNANPNATSLSFLLQKLVTNANVDVWNTVATLNNNALGIFYGINTILGHNTYAGYALNWAEVLDNHGAGIYRIKITTAFKAGTGCLQTDCFLLRQFNCDLATGTVKYETWSTGQKGDPYTDYFLHDVCGINWYDSFRYRGFFGDRGAPEYKEIRTEWGNPKHGYMEHVRDETLLQYKWESNYMAQPYHDRAEVFLMMANEIRVSDYNISNSDYNIKRILVIKDGNYVPVNHDDKWRRISKVTTNFKRGVQGIISTICCPTRPGQGG